MSTTTFTEIDRDFHKASFPASRETIIIRIEGQLADRICRRFSREGEVRMAQYGKEDLDGVEYATVQWVWDCVLCIDGEVVRVERADRPVFEYDSKGQVYSMGKTGTTKMARWLIELEQVGA